MYCKSLHYQHRVNVKDVYEQAHSTIDRILLDSTCKVLTAFSLDINRWRAWNTNSSMKALCRSDLSGLLAALCLKSESIK